MKIHNMVKTMGLLMAMSLVWGCYSSTDPNLEVREEVAGAGEQQDIGTVTGEQQDIVTFPREQQDTAIVPRERAATDITDLKRLIAQYKIDLGRVKYMAEGDLPYAAYKVDRVKELQAKIDEFQAKLDEKIAERE